MNNFKKIERGVLKMSINNDFTITVEKAFHNLYCSGHQYNDDSEEYRQLEDIILGQISKAKDKYELKAILNYQPLGSTKIEEAIREKEKEFKTEP